MNRPRDGWFAAAGSRVARHGPWLLVLSFLILLPTKNLFHLPVVLMAAGGVAVMVRRSARSRLDFQITALTLLFLSLWVPMLLSLPDAVNASRSGYKVLLYPRFFLAGVFAVWALHAEPARRRLFQGVTLVVLFWSIDGLWQWLLDRDLFGYPLDPTRLQGIFYPRYSLGIVLATIAPLYFEGIRDIAPRRFIGWILALPLFVVVLLSGSRTGWILLLVATVGYVVYLRAFLGARTLTRGNLAMATVLLGAMAVAALQYPGVRARLPSGAGLLSGDVELLDIATQRRLSIWRPALKMARAHWLNGVGPRGFRYRFEAFAGPENFWWQPGFRGATHPHLQWLEIAVETGVIGVVGLVLFFGVLYRLTTALPPGRRYVAIPALLGVLMAISPLNAHKAFYGSFWSSLTWWLIALFVAVYGATRSDGSDQIGNTRPAGRPSARGQAAIR